MVAVRARGQVRGVVVYVERAAESGVRSAVPVARSRPGPSPVTADSSLRSPERSDETEIENRLIIWLIVIPVLS